MNRPVGRRSAEFQTAVSARNERKHNPRHRADLAFHSVTCLERPQTRQTAHQFDNQQRRDFASHTCADAWAQDFCVTHLGSMSGRLELKRTRPLLSNARCGHANRCVMTVGIALLMIGMISACSTAAVATPSLSATPVPLSESLPFNIHATPEVSLMFDPNDRLAPPLMSDPPTQADLGHYVYYMSCMVCHGDRGQGLTEEWRTVLDPADQNCWQSKCHAPNHPPEGFQIPRQSPAIMGAGALGAYKTGADLYEYLRVKMPWSFPGLFADEEYWQLTAYLARANEIDFQEPIGPHNAANIVIVPRLPQTHHSAFEDERFIGIAVLGLLAGAAVLHRWTRAGG
jgi:hypothetical protein